MARLTSVHHHTPVWPRHRPLPKHSDPGARQTPWSGGAESNNYHRHNRGRNPHQATSRNSRSRTGPPAGWPARDVRFCYSRPQYTLDDGWPQPHQHSAAPIRSTSHRSTSVSIDAAKGGVWI